MALDPELVRTYAESRQAYEALRDRALSLDSPELLEAREQYREKLAEYLLDLEVNGMTVPDDLRADVEELGR